MSQTSFLWFSRVPLVYCGTDLVILKRLCKITSTVTFISLAILVAGVVHAVDLKSKVQRLTGLGEDGHRPRWQTDLSVSSARIVTMGKIAMATS